MTHQYIEIKIKELERRIEALEQPKIGHWIFKHFDEDTGISNSHWCSECNTPLVGVYKNYCPNCGAKMEEDKITKEKTIEELKFIKERLPIEFRIAYEKTIDKAIKSLEAWDKVKKEIQDEKDEILDSIEDEYFRGDFLGLKIALNIINKYLGEIEE